MKQRIEEQKKLDWLLKCNIWYSHKWKKKKKEIFEAISPVITLNRWKNKDDNCNKTIKKKKKFDMDRLDKRNQ